MDWIVFGDDWGAHPSTTQHLARRLPKDDPVIWIDSIGMRAPRMTGQDLKRVGAKLKSLAATPFSARRAGAGAAGADAPGSVRRLRPKVAPFHLTAAVRAANAASLSRDVRALYRGRTPTDLAILCSNPAAVAYLDALPAGRLGYLRLDDYARLPGVDAALVDRFEPEMMRRADVIFYTARALAPPEPWAAKAHYLPQGVDAAHFAQASLEPPRRKVLGYFGLMAEWVDHELIAAVARRRPDWTLRFVGEARFIHPSLRAERNIAFAPAVPFERLPMIVSDWSAGWIPRKIDAFTKAMNPLKLREYLAIGLPTHCTPLPEAEALAARAEMFVSGDADAVAAWMDAMLVEDDADRRAARRASVAADSWEERAASLRRLMRADRAP